MYFSVYHQIALFICTVLGLFALALVIYSYRKNPEKASAKKELIGYGCIVLALWFISTAGTIMALDGYLKDTQLGNIKSSSIGDEVLISARIFNTGKVSVQSCTITARITSTAKRKVDGSIFAPRWFDANKLKNRTSYEFSQDVKRLIRPNHSEFISIKIPRPFNEYSLKVRHSCF